MASCSVRGCSNSRKFPNIERNISFHRFPRGELLKAWLTAIGKNDKHWKWSRNKVVCSDHFHENDFVYCNSKKTLKSNAAPSLKLGTSGEKQQQTTSDKVMSTGPVMTEASTSNITVTPIACNSFKTSRGKKRKTATSINLTSSSSASTDSDTKRKRVQLVKFFHSYSVSPRKLKEKNITLHRKNVALKKKLYSSEKKIKNLKQTIFNMKNVMAFVKNSHLVSEDALDNLEKTYDSVPHLLMSRYLKNVRNETISHESYPPILRRFAATLQFYSGKAYEAVRSEFALALPHQSTIRKWYQNINCEPGFITPAFDALKLKVEELREANHELICALVLDEIAIKKQLDVDGKQAWGYVNIGVPTENDDLTPASEALVLMVVCLTGHWKLPVAYFFIASLSAKQKANVIIETLIRLENVGVSVPSVTCDGPTTNFAMLRELGCEFENASEMKTWFHHPSDKNKKVFCILDACHMLKLVRNNWANLEEMRNPNGLPIKWTYVKKLYEVQENETLHIGNKLKRAHMEWYKQKMKVHLAAQTLSNSVADAIEFLNTTCQLNAFKGSEATVEFIRTVNNLFDVLNSRSPHSKGLKAPLRMSNEEIWKPFLLNTIRYLLQCTDIEGRPLYMTPKKTPFLGFVISSLSVCGIFDALVKSEKLRYFLTLSLFCALPVLHSTNNVDVCVLHVIHTQYFFKCVHTFEAYEF